ncbi:hypothetical protein PV04_02999 [Phialophora macrospora]|uniref:Amino acid permease/ SLC12A domain-containing protein n=1 Tax=Phialophora macrospora TaxID=1851006 RepID=A0A0D2FQY2_9EURO|nr:hypothetical protein PV04_02999 [Phialophora macrospora]
MALSAEKYHDKMVAEKGFPLEPVVSTETSGQAGEVYNEDEAFGTLHRSFTPRQIHIISLGSNVGSGLFIATGKALANGGPGSMFLAYLMVCSGVWANLQALGEMTIAFPTSGNYIDYAGRWVDPALAFGAGFAEWLGWTAVFAAEATFFVVLVDFWAENRVPEAALLSIFIVICLIVFLLPNVAFAWLQCIGSLVKIILFIFILFLSFALIAGAGPTGQRHTGTAWRQEAFKNGFGGFAQCALLAIWAVGDQVFIGVMGGEAKSPRYSMAHAATLVPLRVGAMYMILVVLVGILIDPEDPNLLGGSGAAASPFVLAVKQAGIKGIPDIVNACMIVGILAIALESIYLPSRMLRTMAVQGLIPKAFGRCDQKGRPRLALAVTSVVGVVMTYMSLSADGLTVLNWFVSITSASFFVNWAIIGVTNLRFHQTLKAQNDKLFEQLYSWRSLAWPFAPTWLLIICAMLTVSLFYNAVSPSAPFSANTFFQYTIGLIIIVVFTLGYKIIMRTKWQHVETADLVTGRHVISTGELQMLDEYYQRPGWRRAATYVSLW